PIAGASGSGPAATAGAGAGGAAPVAGGGGDMMPVDPPVPMGEWSDPGPNPWVLVPEDKVAEECKMDIAKLKATGITQSFAIFRYGKLCYESGRDSASDVFSCTKSFGGIVTGHAQYLVKDVPKTGPGTGQFHDYDLASEWGLAGYGQQKLAFLASMATGSRGVNWGERSFSYDTIGAAGLNPFASVVNKALGQAQMSGVANIQAATRNLFMKLGMSNSAWGGSVYGTGATTTLHDMGKLFTMMIHGGVYNKERLLSEEWVYKMTHPALEDANTSYGQFMWLNHRGNAAGIGGDIGSGSNTKDGDPCSPAAFWNKYPHEVSKSPDCYKTVATASCDQKYDTGNFSCQGLGGQFAIGHPGLDLVLTVKNFSGQNGPMGFWDKIRPAIVALDPMYTGDNDAFCKAYGAGDYAPDLKVQIQQPPDPMP
ncbi:MAG TPA: hypothetical protein VK509_00225, partial [Polyangiales bacterium]|nr:hypothetical protein [Polyangiales bacterium]